MGKIEEEEEDENEDDWERSSTLAFEFSNQKLMGSAELAGEPGAIIRAALIGIHFIEVGRAVGKYRPTGIGWKGRSRCGGG